MLCLELQIVWNPILAFDSFDCVQVLIAATILLMHPSTSTCTIINNFRHSLPSGVWPWHLNLGWLRAVDIARCLELVGVIGLLLLRMRRISLKFAVRFLALSVKRMLIGLVLCWLLDQAGIVAVSALLALLIDIVSGKIVLEFLWVWIFDEKRSLITLCHPCSGRDHFSRRILLLSLIYELFDASTSTWWRLGFGSHLRVVLYVGCEV